MKTFKLNRRKFITGTGAGIALGGAMASGLSLPAYASDRAIKIGFVSPQTGPLAPFGEADSFTIDAISKFVANGITIAGKNRQVEIIVKDSQSNSNRAAEVASDLILNDEIDLMLVASTPETTTPVGDQCELNGIPCISTIAPWQPWFFSRGGEMDSGFDYTFHFFWGLEDIIGTFTSMWSQLDTNKHVGGLFPNDGDGLAWGDPKLGFPPVLEKLGYGLTDPGRYQNLTDDFSSYISDFKSNDAQIITGVMIPPDFTTFWTQAKQQGFAPMAATIGKAILFPSAIEALGDQGHNLSSEVWWSPNHPFKSSLSGATAGELAASYESTTGKQWTQPIGFIHALFEVAFKALDVAGGPGDPDALAEALRGLKMESVVGPLNWADSPIPNVAKTPVVGGQWRQGGKHKYDLVITSNDGASDIPLGGEMEALA